MKKIKVFGYTIALLFFPYLTAQNRSFVSLACNFVTIGGPNTYIHTTSFFSSPYVGAGANFEYSRRIIPTAFNGMDIVDTLKKQHKIRWFTQAGVRINFTRYGIQATSKIPFDQDFSCSTRRYSINISQTECLNLSKSIFISLSIIEGFSISSVSGDTIVSKKYGLINENGNMNLRSFSFDISGCVSFKIALKLYLGIGYTQGLINVIKKSKIQYPVSREFYPFIRLAKTF